MLGVPLRKTPMGGGVIGDHYPVGVLKAANDKLIALRVPSTRSCAAIAGIKPVTMRTWFRCALGQGGPREARVSHGCSS